MRIDRLIILLIIITACKGTQTTQSNTASYKEDLSVHRKAFTAQQEKPAIDDMVVSEPVVLEGHIKDELDSINSIIIQENKTRPIDGFEIQVYNGNSRQDASDILEEIKEMYPELEPYMSYHQPNYKVKAGRFFDRLAATRTYEELKEYFPRALLIPGRYQLQDGG